MVRLVTGEGEGSMAEMFRHALTDFPQWSPTALSLEPPSIQARSRCAQLPPQIDELTANCLPA